MFGAGDEITSLVLEMNAFSTKDTTRLTLNAKVFGGRNELTHLVIETNAFGIGDEHQTQSQATFLNLSADLWQH